ncbi:alkaline phosphatase family protein [Pseudonocardia acidicola]|uniref:Acid phosphatase n=1 Tax=Pseudonocardia acidicola TaxID=2724939 RepID=A0ABX1SC43_9PSEU|nr:alkaline phosphatase family protein [Pseudonocardia acidicola]NMH97753.1 acid phosphatase [Pseudonocardia acidicola]
MQSRGSWKAFVGVVAIAFTVVTGCSATGPTPDPDAGGPAVATAPGAVPHPDHVMMVVFENKNASAVVGSADAPYLTALAKAGANFTDAHGVAHPSQPNYIALLSGSRQGVTDDSCPQALSGPNLPSELLATGHSFVGYSEDLPNTGFTGCTSGEYARKHNPWVDFPNLPASVNQPLAAIPRDYSMLPTVSFVVPNMCNDMHDCPVAAGDAWARRQLSSYVSWAATHNSLLIVTFDEDGGTDGNHIPTIMVGPMVRPGDTGQPIDHYNVLRTIEDMYGLPALGEAGSAHPITGIWIPDSPAAHESATPPR